ncbi:unnamed protein product [Rotaria sp. Silwood2]|nr:unnamed protein product [Rotaria sp. Silwood2]CAF2860638.1 unnamed protein product [Rotaria sp. Silwood2]
MVYSIILRNLNKGHVAIQFLSIDRVPFGILFLFKSTNQSRLASLAKITSTNQLLDLRKSSMDSVSLFHGCPH